MKKLLALTLTGLMLTGLATTAVACVIGLVVANLLKGSFPDWLADE